jgi:hypothetical protein
MVFETDAWLIGEGQRAVDEALTSGETTKGSKGERINLRPAQFQSAGYVLAEQSAAMRPELQPLPSRNCTIRR